MSNDVETTKSMIVTVAETQLPDDLDDGLWFDTSDTHATVIRDEDEYSGVRVTLGAELSTAHMRFHVDVNVGDPIWPSTATVPFPPELERFQRLTVGRELKMIELKKEIEYGWFR